MVLLLALLIVGSLVWLAVAQPWRGASEAAPDTENPGASATAAPAVTEPAPSAEPTPTGAPTPQPCDPKDLEVTGIADQSEYAADQDPRFSIELTNSGDAECLLNVGTTTQRFTVMSGADTWWKSTDCQSEPSDMEVTLDAGQTVTSAEPVVWDRTRSSVDTCDSDSRPAAPASGASYHLQVEIGGVAAAETTQFVLN